MKKFHFLLICLFFFELEKVVSQCNCDSLFNIPKRAYEKYGMKVTTSQMDSVLNYYLSGYKHFKRTACGNIGIPNTDTVFDITAEAFFDLVRLENTVRFDKSVNLLIREQLNSKIGKVLVKYMASISSEKIKVIVKSRCKRGKNKRYFRSTDGFRVLNFVVLYRKKIKTSIECYSFRNTTIYWNEFVSHRNNFYYVVPDP